MSIVVVDAHEAAGESHHLTEGYEDGLFDFAHFSDIESAEEEHHASDGQNGGCDELYVGIQFHKRFLISGAKIV